MDRSDTRLIQCSLVLLTSLISGCGVLSKTPQSALERAMLHQRGASVPVAATASSDSSEGQRITVTQLLANASNSSRSISTPQQSTTLTLQFQPGQHTLNTDQKNKVRQFTQSLTGQNTAVSAHCIASREGDRFSHSYAALKRCQQLQGLFASLGLTVEPLIRYHGQADRVEVTVPGQPL